MGAGAGGSHQHRTIGRLTSVNVGTPRTVEWFGRSVTSAIWKEPVDGRRRVAGINVDGDDQADRRVHGGDTKAVYAYASEDYSWWSEVLGDTVGPGTFGDNLTTLGIDLGGSVIGERWRIGDVLLRVTEPRIPCFKLGVRMGDGSFPDRFAAARRPGTYLSIDEPGTLGGGDVVERIDRPAHGVTIGHVNDAYHGDHHLLGRLLDVEELSPAWRDWAAGALRRARRSAPGGE